MTDSAPITPHISSTPRAERWQQLGMAGATVWFTGLSGAGKSTAADALSSLLLRHGVAHYVLDGDNLRHGLNSDLGFSEADRNENVRRLGEVACLLADAGLVAIVAAISPYREQRDKVRATHTAHGLRFLEVFMDTSLDVCRERDPKGLYARADAGTLSGLTGVDAPYEFPTQPDVRLSPAAGSPAEMAQRVFDRLVPHT
jgi:bifunctional enzyme CysN/CysC